jgi:hypothetical protein
MGGNVVIDIDPVGAPTQLVYLGGVPGVEGN